MKKLFYLLAGIICISFVSCEQNSADSYTSFSSAADLNGIWVTADGDYKDGMYSFEIKGSNLTYRYHPNGYIDDDNNLICRPEVKTTFKFEFNQAEQAIYVMGIKVGTYTRLEKDKAIFNGEVHPIWGFQGKHTLQRVKGIKEV